MKKILALSLLASFIALPAMADEQVFNLSIKDHQFTPATLEIPAGQKVKLLVKNLDKSAEEFESHELNREKVIAAGAEAVVYVGPLTAGEYKFFGDFHQDTAKGTIVVK